MSARRRLWAAAESIAIGYGGDALVSAATGLARETIRNGRRELADGATLAPDGFAGPGPAGPSLETRPTGPDRGVGALGRSAHAGRSDVAAAMDVQESRAVDRGVDGARLAREFDDGRAHLLHALGYRLQALRKTREGSQHPDRNAQFEHINATAATFLQPGPAGDLRRHEEEGIGRRLQECRPGMAAHGDARARARARLPERCGRARRSRTASTTWRATKPGSASAATTTRPPSPSPPIRQWWTMMGRAAYPGATHLLITADAGGSNGYRSRAWKTRAAAPGRRPPAAHHRLATSHRARASGTRSSIGSSATSPRTGAAAPLRTFETIVDLIGHTSTATGLRVRAKLDKRRYRTGVKVTAAEMRDVALHPHDFHGDWNYEIRPRAT